MQIKETKETKENDKEDSDDEDIAVKPSESDSQPLGSSEPLGPSGLLGSLEPQPKSILSTVKNALDSAKSDLQAIQSELQDGSASDLPLVELNEVSESPQVINLDEKPSVSFAKYNTIFSSEDPDESNMVEAEDKSPDLEILDTVGSALNNNDFDQLDDDSEILEMDNYEVL